MRSLAHHALHAARRRRSAPAGTRLPLSALRCELDEPSADSRWTVDVDGLFGRGLLMGAPAAVTYPLTLDHDVRLQGRIQLLPHDWRDGRGGVRGTVEITRGDGSSRRLWRGVVFAANRGGSPRGRRIACHVPADAVALRLIIEAQPPGPRAVARALWLEPALLDPLAAPVAIGAERSPTGTAAEPSISVLMPVHDPPLFMLHEAVDSVIAQTYPRWQLCLVDDGSRDPDVIAALRGYAEDDPRIVLTRHQHGRGIAAATNTALAAASGDYIALLDHDDTLTADALASVAGALVRDPGLDMVYSDEDILLDGRQIWVHHKPAWSPDTLRTNGYTCHLGVYRRSLVQEIGGFRSAYDGSQDVDMILRLIERSDRVAHVPEILYHWRAHLASTAGGDAKPYAYVSARNAIEGHLARRETPAKVGFGPPGLYRVAHRVADTTTVELVLGCDNADGIAAAARSWTAQPHTRFGVVVSTTAAAVDAVAAALRAAGIDDSRTTIVPADDGSTNERRLRQAAARTRAEHLLLMSGPAAGVTHDWLRRLIGYSAEPGIATAGPVVLAADGRIQDAGVALPEGIALPLLHGTRSSMDDFFGYGTSVYNVAALSGTVITSRTRYERLGGLDPEYGELALIEYCLRGLEGGDRNVLVPDARLQATIPDRRGNDLPSLWRLRKRWASAHAGDPFYNQNYRADRGDFTLRRDR